MLPSAPHPSMGAPLYPHRPPTLATVFATDFPMVMVPLHWLLYMVALDDPAIPPTQRYEFPQRIVQFFAWQLRICEPSTPQPTRAPTLVSLYSAPSTEPRMSMLDSRSVTRSSTPAWLPTTSPIETPLFSIRAPVLTIFAPRTTRLRSVASDPNPLNRPAL